MKIRTAFVSNSSTTSFCMHGVALEEEEALWDFALEEEDAPVRVYWVDCAQYIGVPFTAMQPDETRRAFEARAEALVNTFLDEAKYAGPRQFGVQEDAWYEG